ncbi:hypothetical protein [uncultured Thiodictyon sp.]|uniref:hypothetical protein n=1 Tax=uncultured Thiodictyon sp. TaxID=1846217 RepID=UPI0025F8628B|nr:hypothetical protein [uncultured Thiodictyon sp.]
MNNTAQLNRTQQIQEIDTFLSLFRDGGEVNIARIVEGANRVDTRFTGDVFGFDDAAGHAWSHNAERIPSANLYFTVNPHREGIESRRSVGKEHIAAAEYLHVDIDPDLAAARGHLLNSTVPMLQASAHPPTFIVDSGNGLGVFWKLRNSFTLPDEEPARGEAIARIETLNKKLALSHGGDNCQDISRLMRLPGTLNHPTAKKLAKGYPVEAGLSGLLAHNPGALYSVEDMEAALSNVAVAVTVAHSGAQSTGSTKETGDETPLGDEEARLLMVRFNAAKDQDSELRKYVTGDKTGGDTTGSGYLFMLAGRLKKWGFTEKEYFHVAFYAENLAADKPDQHRQIWRAWDRSDTETGKPTVAQMFDNAETLNPPPLPPRTNARRACDRNIDVAAALQRFVFVKRKGIVDLTDPPDTDPMSVQQLKDYLASHKTKAKDKDKTTDDQNTFPLWETSKNRQEADALGYAPSTAG